MTADQPCPVGCGRTHRDGQLMCKPCWFEVPVRNAVNNTWRSWKRDFSNADAMAAYRAARDAALSAVA